MKWNELTSKKSTEAFQLNGFESPSLSAWIPYNHSADERIEKLHPLEELQNDPNNLIKQFHLLESEQLPHFLTDWLSQTNLEATTEDRQELRDFIYEMF